MTPKEQRQPVRKIEQGKPGESLYETVRARLEKLQLKNISDTNKLLVRLRRAYLNDKHNEPRAKN